jgi:DNA-binding GntR family transcriptional regulator/imidazolonepropionase-like amidohydrolase
MQMRALPRSRLRDDIVLELEKLISSGELDVTRLKEVQLATQLGVSRTPLREALLILERQGLVESEAHKGFRIAPVTERKVREIYPQLGALEALAVRTGTTKLRDQLPALRALNARLLARSSKLELYTADRTLHETLWAGAGNASLVETLRRLWLQVQPYDGATRRGIADPEGSERGHAAVLDAIEAKKPAEAARLVEAHWRAGIEVVLGWLRSTRAASLLACVVLAIAGCSQPARPPSATEASSPVLPDEPFGAFIDEAQVETLVAKLSREHRPETVAFEHVSVIAMTGGNPLVDQTVVVEDGVIRQVGPAASITIPANARRIAGRGRFLMPGLVDMHVHTNLSSGDFLLDLANGVTSVREMNGSDWLAEQRKQVRANTLLIPNLYIAGRILASRPMSWYAQVVTTPEEARAAVRQHHAAGRDFIKVHNVVARDVYDAICAEARALGLDVVGHIPHEITVREAITCGQRTFEHFKSYINDRNLTLTREDYVAATRGAEVWNTPTFYNHRTHARGDDARRLLALPEMQYVPARTRATWLALADIPEKPIQYEVFRLSKLIYQALRPIGARFLAGTDSGGGYPYHVPGFALHEELRIMTELGASPEDALRSATREPAVAMRRERELGTIAPGMRADLVLLRANPLAAIANLATIEAVMVRGIYLPRETLDAMLAKLAEIRRTRSYTRADLDAALATLAQLRASGHVLRDHMLGWLRFHLEAAKLPVDRLLFRGVAAIAPDED